MTKSGPFYRREQKYGGQRLLACTVEAYDLLCKRITDGSRLLVYSHGRNQFADHHEFPYYVLVTRRSDGAGLGEADVEHVDRLLRELSRCIAAGKTLPARTTGAGSEQPDPVRVEAMTGHRSEPSGRTDQVVSTVTEAVTAQLAATRAEIASGLSSVSERIDSVKAAVPDIVTDVVSSLWKQMSPTLEALAADNEDVKSLLLGVPGAVAHQRAKQALEDARKEIDALRAEREHERQELVEERQGRLTDRSATQAREEELRRRLVRAEHEQRFDLPTTLADALGLLGSMYPSSVLVHEDAVKSAESAGIAKGILSTRDMGRIWKLLQSLAIDLHGLAFAAPGGDLEKQYMDRTGIELALREGKQTNRNSQLAPTRQVLYKGCRVECTPHVKETIDGKHLRVHVYLDHESGIVVICHCGDHLPTAGTRRQR